MKRDKSKKLYNVDLEDDHKRELNNDRIIITALIGICGILINLFLDGFHFKQEYMHTIGHLLRDGGIAFLTAAIITYIIEIPNTLDYFKERIIDAMKDANYLKELSDVELERIKAKCNKLIFLKQGKRDESYLNESLIEFEEEIFQLLMKPYYDYYIITVDSIDFEATSEFSLPNQKCTKKIIQTNFKLVNPLSTETTERLLVPLTFYCPENFGSCDTLFRILRLRIKVDDHDFEDLNDKVKIVIENFTSTKYPNYNKRLHFKLKNEDGSFRDMEFTFSNEIILELEEERYISADDKIFTKRMDRPTKNFTVNYLYQNPNFKIKADCFYTLPGLTDSNVIRTEHSNSVFVESKTWFLPGNGIHIAIVPLEEAVTYQRTTVEEHVETHTTTETTTHYINLENENNVKPAQGGEISTGTHL